MRTSKPRMTAFERQRRDWSLAGYTVLANGHTDRALIAWAKHQGRLYRIDRRSAWGNPTHLLDPEDEVERDACVRAYASYFETAYDLQARIRELAGKVLLCWCTPKACHGEVLLSESDPQFAAEYLATCREILTQEGSPAPGSHQLPLW